MKYKMIVSDFDNTLCNRKKEVSERTRNAIKKYIASGGIFVLCTTRPYGGIEKIAKGLELNGPIICNQGASIRSLYDDSEIHLSTFTKDEVTQIINFYSHLTRHLFVAGDYNMKSKCKDVFMRLGENGVGYPLTKTETTLIDETDNFNVSQILAGSYSKAYVKVLYALGKWEFEDKFEIGLCDKYLINLVPKGCGKGTAIKKLAEANGIEKSEIIAFGDSTSDYPMFRYSGTGVAMGNAKKSLKNHADFICDDCEHDGVAKFIEENCLD